MGLALAFALAVHVVLLASLRWKQPSSTFDPPLSVRIVPPAPNEAPEPRDPIPPVEEPAPPTPVVMRRSPPKPPPPADTSRDEPARVSGHLLRERALVAIRSQRRQVSDPDESNRTRSFTIDDLPVHGPDADPFADDSVLSAVDFKKFARRPQTIESYSPEGFLEVRHVDEWGNVSCARRVGFPGDGNPPLWYPIIGDACFVPDQAD